MPSKYYLTLTTYGSDLIAQAHESAPLNLKNLVIGDANGVPYDPLTAIDRTHLVNQKASVLIQHLEVIGDIVRVTATIGPHIGGFNIHEIGLTDESGQLVYIGNYHGGYKSLFEDGAGGELTISIDIQGVATNNINLIVDPHTNTATQAWLENILKAYIKSDSFETTANYIKLPSGIIIQWDRIFFQSEGQQVTFPITFPTECFIVNPGSGEHVLTVAEVLNYGSVTNQGFKCWATASCYYSYIAIGR